jgi:ferritin
LQWYVSEQIEEESLARNVLDKLKLIGADKGGIYFFDRDLGAMAAATISNEQGGSKA